MTTQPARRESCWECGREWGVTTEPRENVLCRGCAHTPRLPDGEVRVSPEGIHVVCTGGDMDLRWHVIGKDTVPGMYGWRYDHQVAGWHAIGNIHDLESESV